MDEGEISRQQKDKIMEKPIHRARLLQPYSALNPDEIWSINLLVEENPDPNPVDVKKALDILMRHITSVFPNANVMMDIRISISNAAADVADSLSSQPPFKRRSESRRLIDRWFKKGASPDDGDAPDVPQRISSRKNRQIDVER